MLKRYKYDHLEWVDAERPSESELLLLSKEFSLHPIVTEELASPSLRPKADRYEDLVYLILHFPLMEKTSSDHPNQEIDFVVGKNFLITVHYDPIITLEKFSQEFEIHTTLNKIGAPEHIGYLFYPLMKKLYESLDEELVRIEEQLEEAENKIFRGEEGKMVVYLSKINRDLLNFKQGTRLHNDVLESLRPAWKTFFGDHFINYLEAIKGTHYKISDTLEGHKETLIDLRETNDSLLSAKTSGIMKTLTIITFSTFPPLLVAGMFSMNSSTLPLVGREDGFWIILSLMILSSFATFGFFLYKKWL